MLLITCIEFIQGHKVSTETLQNLCFPEFLNGVSNFHGELEACDLKETLE